MEQHEEEVGTTTTSIPEMQASKGTGWRAIVLGATGATGKQLVRELIESPKWSHVTLIGRRSSEEFSSEKVVQVVIDMDNMNASSESFKDHDAAFNLFGTTKKDAGSAEAFRKIDHGYAVTFASLCKERGVRHFHLLTASNSNPNSWFLYPRTKGEIEEDVKAMSFERTTIWQPGLLGRGDKARFIERLAGHVMSEMPVERLAHSIRLQAEHLLEAEHTAASEEQQPVAHFSNKEINAIASSSEGQ